MGEPEPQTRTLSEGWLLDKGANSNGITLQQGAAGFHSVEVWIGVDELEAFEATEEGKETDEVNAAAENLAAALATATGAAADAELEKYNDACARAKALLREGAAEKRAELHTRLQSQRVTLRRSRLQDLGSLSQGVDEIALAQEAVRVELLKEGQTELLAEEGKLYKAAQRRAVESVMLKQQQASTAIVLNNLREAGVVQH